LLNLAPISLSNMLNRGSMTSSSLVVLRVTGPNEHQMPGDPVLVTTPLT